MKKNLLSICLSAALLVGCNPISKSDVADQTASPKPANASNQAMTSDVLSHVSGTTFMTNNFDESLDFYRDYFGYVTRVERNLTASGSRAVFSLKEGETNRYAVLVPAEWTKERSDFPGLGFLETLSANPSKSVRNPDREPIAGEVVFAFDVTNIEETAKKMEAAGVPIIDPLTISPSGLSKTITVLDPNNMRVQLYQWVKKPK